MTGGIGQNPNLYNYQAFLNKKQAGFKGDFQSPVSPDVTQQAGQVADQARQQAQQGPIGHAAQRVIENKDKPDTTLLGIGAGVLSCSFLKKIVDPLLYKANCNGYTETRLFNIVKDNASKDRHGWEILFNNIQEQGKNLFNKIPTKIRRRFIVGWNVASPAVETFMQPSVEVNARKTLLDSLKKLTKEQLDELPKELRNLLNNKKLMLDNDGLVRELKRVKYDKLFNEAFEQINKPEILTKVSKFLDVNSIPKPPEGALDQIISLLNKSRIFIFNKLGFSEKEGKNLAITLNMRGINQQKLGLPKKLLTKAVFWARNQFANNPAVAGIAIGMSINGAINAKEKKFSTFISDFCQFYIGMYLIAGPIGKGLNAIGGLRKLPQLKGDSPLHRKVVNSVLRNTGKIFSWGQGWEKYADKAVPKGFFSKFPTWFKNGGSLPINFPARWSVAGISRTMVVQTVAGAIIGATLLKVLHGIFGKPPEEDKEKDKTSEKKPENTNSATTQKPAAAPGMPETSQKIEQSAKPEAPAMPSTSKSSVTSSNPLIQELINKKKNAPKEENNLASQPIGAKKLDKKEAAPEEEVYLPSATAPKYLEKAQAEQQKKVQVSTDLLTKSNDLLAKTDRILKGDFKDM